MTRPSRARVLARLIASLTLAIALLAPSAARAAGPPSAFFDEIAGIGATQATFKGRVDDNDVSTQWWFRVCKVSECPVYSEPPGPGSSSEQPGPDEQETPRDFYDAASYPRPYPVAVTFGDGPGESLEPATQYKVTLYTNNDFISTGEAYPSQTRTFTTASSSGPAANAATRAASLPASNLTAGGAVLNGAVVPGTTGSVSEATSVYFEWGEGAGTVLDRTTPAQQVAGNDREVNVSAALTGLLTNVTYSYRVVAVRNGVRYAGGQVSFRLTPVPVCTGGATYRAALIIGNLVASGCFRSVGDNHVGHGEIKLNGLTLTPSGSSSGGGYDFPGCTSSACKSLQGFLDGDGHRVYIDASGKAIGTKGPYRVAGGVVDNLHTGRLGFTGVDFDGPGALFTLGATEDIDLFGFPIAGQFDFTPKADGSSVLSMVMGLPSSFGGVRGESRVRVSAAGDFVLDRLRIDVGTARLKIFDVGQLSFLYDRLTDSWEGAAKLNIPTRPAPVEIGVAVVVTDGRFSSLAGEVDDLNRLIGKGIFLQKVGANFALNPLTLGGVVGVSAGPSIRLSKSESIKAVAVDGNFEFKDSFQQEVSPRVYRSYPPGLKIGGKLFVANLPLAKAEVGFYFSDIAWIDMSGEMGFDFNVGGTSLATLLGTVSGSVYGTDFSLDGNVRFAIAGRNLAGASSYLNQNGIAACAYANPFVFGAWYRWGGSGGTFGDSCGLTKLRGLVAAASTAQAGAKPLKVPARKRLYVLRFKGTGTAPEVRLRGPGGRTISMPAAGQRSALLKGASFVAREPATASTIVQIANTGAGGWSYEVLPGSSGVRAVEGAGLLPAPAVRARVKLLRSKAKGKRRARRTGRALLRWRLRPLAGQRVVFREEGAGAPTRVLLRTNRSRGTLRFRPAAVRERRRTITATVEQGGLPRSSKVVARFRAPALPKLRRPLKLRAKRASRGRAVVSWRRVKAARRYAMLLRYRDGRRTLRIVRRTRVRLSGAPARDLVAVSVRGIGSEGRSGPVARAKLRR